MSCSVSFHSKFLCCWQGDLRSAAETSTIVQEGSCSLARIVLLCSEAISIVDGKPARPKHGGSEWLAWLLEPRNSNEKRQLKETREKTITSCVRFLFQLNKQEFTIDQLRKENGRLQTRLVKAEKKTARALIETLDKEAADFERMCVSRKLSSEVPFSPQNSLSTRPAIRS